MKLIKFKDYEEYKNTQIKGYTAKVDSHSWVDTYSVRGLVSYLNEYNSDISFGLCHGTRRGLEQEQFINGFKSLDKDVKVIGTEIAPDASTRFSNTIEWDFHKVKDEWIGNVDFIYSNSFDHSYEPEKCLDAWMSCLNEKGLCILEWNKDAENNPRPMDPFAASYDEYKEMIEKKYEIVDILESEPKHDESLMLGARTITEESGRIREVPAWIMMKDFTDGTVPPQRYYFIIRNKDIDGKR